MTKNKVRDRKPLVLVTPHRYAVDIFIHDNYPGVKVEDLIWIRSKHDLDRVRGLELDLSRVHFLYEYYLIENAKEEIMARVRNNPVKE